MILLMISYQDLYKAEWKFTKRLWKRFGYFFGLFGLLAVNIIIYTRVMNTLKMNIRYW